MTPPPSIYRHCFASDGQRKQLHVQHVHTVDDLFERLRGDPSLLRAVGGVYAAQTHAATVAELAARVGEAAAGRRVRLSVFPRTLRTELEALLPSEVRLTPTAHELCLFAVQPASATSGYWWALRPSTATSTIASAASPCPLDALGEAVARGRWRPGHGPTLLVHAAAAPLPSALAAIESDVTCVEPSGRALQLELPATSPPLRYAACAITLGVDLGRSTMPCSAALGLLRPSLAAGSTRKSLL